MIGIEFLRELNIYTIVGRTVLSLIIGGIIGLEREAKNQAAGFRTYMLVCLGATLVMMTNQYVSNEFSGDPTRLGAQVISGIGFLGAGSIIVTKRSQIRGLTTAAGLWSAACIGIAIGIGFYEGALVGGIAILLVMSLLHKIDSLLMSNAKVFHIYTNFASIEALNQFVECCKEWDVKVVDLQFSKANAPGEEGIAAMMILKRNAKGSHVELMQRISGVEGLRYIEEI